MNAHDINRARRRVWQAALALSLLCTGNAKEIPIPERHAFRDVRVDPSGVSISAKSALLNDLLADLCYKSGVRYNGDPALVDPMDVFFENVPLDKALLRLLGNASYVIVWAYDFQAARPRDVCRPIAVWVRPRETHPAAGGFPSPPPDPSRDAVLAELVSRLSHPEDAEGFLKAAHALADRGTPEAIRPLFETMEKLPAGDLRDNLTRIAMSLTNAVAISVLSDSGSGAHPNPGASRQPN